MNAWYKIASTTMCVCLSIFKKYVCSSERLFYSSANFHRFNPLTNWSKLLRLTKISLKWVITKIKCTQGHFIIRSCPFTGRYQTQVKIFKKWTTSVCPQSSLWSFCLLSNKSSCHIKAPTFEWWEFKRRLWYGTTEEVYNAVGCTNPVSYRLHFD